MKFYLAGSISPENRTMMVNIAKILRHNLDFKVYCPWELKIDKAWDLTQEDWAKKVFEADCNAIKDCDIFILITPGRKSTAGSNFEQGMAFALNKKIIVLQITDEPTSLMTYCGATVFINCSHENVYEELQNIVTAIENEYFFDFLDKGMYSKYCKTTLT